MTWNRITRLALTLLFAFVFDAAADDGLAAASELVDSGKHAEAVDAYRVWINEHASGPGMVEIVTEVATRFPDLRHRKTVFEGAVAAAARPADLHRLLVMLAETEEQLGNIGSAQRYFQAASFALPGEKDFRSLLRSALLAFELGEYGNAEAQARVIIDTGRSEQEKLRATVLLSRVYFSTDRSERAFALLTDGRTIRPGIGSEGLYWLYRMSELSGESELSSRAVEMLQTDFAESLEASMASGGAKRLPSASAVMEATAVSRPSGTSQPSGNVAVAENRVEPSPGAPSNEAKTVAIQTGSYTVLENAQYAAADLRAEGFAAEIRERVVNGVRYFRVVLSEISAATLSRTLLELKDAGFEGFPLYE